MLIDECQSWSHYAGNFYRTSDRLAPEPVVEEPSD